MNKKDDPLRILYPAIEYCNQFLIRLGIKKLNRERERLFQELYIGESIRMEVVHFYRKAALITTICIITVTFFAAVELINRVESGSTIKKEITRPKAGSGESSVILDFRTLEGEQGRLEIGVSEQKLMKEEVDLLFEESKKYIDQHILGDNVSTNEVRSRLYLITEIPGSSVSIHWSVSDTSYIDKKGIVFNENLKESKLVQLEAELSYYEYQEIYSQYINILPKEYTKEEQLLNAIKNKISEVDKSTQKEESLKLPEKLDDYSIIWRLPKKKTGTQIVLLGGIACIGIYLGMEVTLQNKRKHRNLQLLIDYPEIVCKFTLLLNAGMTIRGAFERITQDYSKRKTQGIKTRKEKKHEPRYAYEEILISIRELNIGRPESIVYEAFGQRCGLLCYLRFSTIIVQNMKKGTKGIVQMLEMEALDAFTERKECAKRLGEEAGTKLLMPMIGMLIIVLLIVLVPAFMNFSV